MADKDKAPEKGTKEPQKSKIKTKLHVLKRNIKIGEVQYKKGDSVPLTEKGRYFLKLQNYIN
jgi:hypothetical protein